MFGTGGVMNLVYVEHVMSSAIVPPHQHFIRAKRKPSFNSFDISRGYFIFAIIECKKFTCLTFAVFFSSVKLF